MYAVLRALYTTNRPGTSYIPNRRPSIKPSLLHCHCPIRLRLLKTTYVPQRGTIPQPPTLRQAIVVQGAGLHAEPIEAI